MDYQRIPEPPTSNLRRDWERWSAVCSRVHFNEMTAEIRQIACGLSVDYTRPGDDSTEYLTLLEYVAPGKWKAVDESGDERTVDAKYLSNPRP